jgi:flavodoxin
VNIIRIIKSGETEPTPYYSIGAFLAYFIPCAFVYGMKTLVVYYSLTGNCRKVAEKVASEISADLEAVEFEDPADIKDGQPAGPVVMGSWVGRLPRIKAPKHDPSAYDIAVIGAPVWAFQLAAPMKAYLKENRGKLPKKTAYFVCYGGMFGGSTLRQMGRLASIKPVTTLLISEKMIRSDDWMQKTREFAARLG